MYYKQGRVILFSRAEKFLFSLMHSNVKGSITRNIVIISTMQTAGIVFATGQNCDCLTP